MSLLLGLDVGTTSIKAVVYRPDGIAVASAAAATPTHVPRPRWAFYRADELWGTVVGVIQRALAQLPDPGQIVSVAVASVAEAGVLLDAQGEATADILAWYDTRTRPQSDWLGEHVGADALFASTGLSLQPIFSLCKMLWYREHEPDAWQRSVHWLLIDEYIAFKLSGERGSEPSQASRTMLMNLHDLAWDQEILDKVEIDERMLPPLVASGTRLGPVTAHAAAETGLPQSALVAAGGHDHVCGAFAAGVTRPGQMLNSLGTAEAVFLPTSAPLTDPQAGRQGYTQGAHVAGGGYYVFGGQYTSGACIDWVRRLLGDGTDPLAYDATIAAAGRVPPGSNGVLFLPHLRMANPPYVDSRSRGAFVGLTVETGREEMARAVLEGIAFETVSTYEPLAEYPQVTMPATSVAIGGGTRNKLLMQIKSSLSGLPYHVLDAEEATALGAALLGGVGAGVFADADEAIAAMRYGQSVVLPVPEDAAVYDRIKRDVYQNVYPALAPLSAAISDLQNSLIDANDLSGSHLLGIDLGTSAVKVVVVDEHGTVKASGSAEYPVLHPRMGWAEQDPDAWWSATVAAIQQALGWAGGSLNIRAIGLSGQMHGVTFLGEGERSLYPAIIWADQRSEPQARAFTQKVGAERLIGIAGSAVASGFMAATIGWMQEEKASIWWRTRHLLSPKDELRRRMTGALATDPGDGAATLLFDGRWRNWSPQLLDAAEVPSALMPQVRPSSAPAGELTREAAEATGLPAQTLVVTGTADTAASLLGAGIVDPDTLLLSLSTGAQVMTPSEVFAPDASGRTHTFCSALEPGTGNPGWYQMGATLVAGMAMRWLRDEMLRLPAAGAYERMTALAERSPLGARGALFLPYLVGERTPHMDAAARGAFLGLTSQHESGDLVRAVMEGVTLATYDAFTVLRETGAAPERIVMAGGGARSPLWRQMVADIFGLPVFALATVDQAAMGAALLAGAGAGMLAPVEASQQWAHYGARSDPDTRRHERYQELSAIFREAYTPVTGVSHRLGAWAQAGEAPRVIPRTIRKAP